MAASWVYLVLAIITSFIGFAWLALAMDVHWKQVQAGKKSHPAKALRILGWLGIAASAIFCFLADRPSIAVLVWIMLLAASAFFVSMLLATRPSWIRRCWR